MVEFKNIHFNTNIENSKNYIKDNSAKDLISDENYEKKLRLKKLRINKEKKNLNTIFTTENIENDKNETSKRQIKNIRNTINFKKPPENNNLNNINTLEKEENQNKIKNNILKKKTNEFSFNIFEIVALLLFPCCLKGQLKIKNYLNEKANNFLYSKLNILLYIRNMILLDIINKTSLDEKNKDIINFLSRPILSLNKNNFEEKDALYDGYKEKDFDRFYESFIELVKKSDKSNREKKLMNLSRQQLKELA